MKRLILVVLLMFSFGCTKTNASYEVTSYLNKFKNHDEQILASLDKILLTKGLSDSQSDLYKLVMKRQYSDLEYDIISEHYNGDEANIEVLITVYDYENSKNKALDEISSTDDKIDLILKMMDKEEKRVSYTLNFRVLYDNGWHLQNPSMTDLEKIHGIYDYEEDQD